MTETRRSKPSVMAVLATFAFLPVAACGVDIQLGPGTYDKEVRADAPTLYLRFGDRSTAVAKDEIGGYPGKYPAEGVTLGEPGAIVGDSDSAVALDGKSVVTMPPGVEFAATKPFTIEVWVKPEVYDARTGYGFVVDHQSYQPRIGYTLRASQFDVALERWAGGTTFGSNATDNRAPSLHAWHHVVATFDSITLKLFVDGALVASNGVPSDMPAVTTSWTIGGPNCECTGNYFAGALDELAIYDHAIDATRARAHFEASGH
jgi:hypothetical protein